MARLPYLVSLKDLDIAARTLWGEARGEPVEGQVAVAWVIRNRVETAHAHALKHQTVHHYGNPYPEAICLKPYAFSCWNKGDPNRARIDDLRTSDPALLTMLAIIARVFAGELEDPTKGAELYEAVPGVPKSWRPERIEETARIGKHTFYREIP